MFVELTTHLPIDHSSHITMNNNSEFQNNQQTNSTTGDTTNNGEKEDWLDKGITGAGQKFGVNISESNADKAGDFANKEVKNKEGFNLPGVQ